MDAHDRLVDFQVCDLSKLGFSDFGAGKTSSKHRQFLDDFIFLRNGIGNGPNLQRDNIRPALRLPSALSLLPQLSIGPGPSRDPLKNPQGLGLWFYLWSEFCCLGHLFFKE